MIKLWAYNTQFSVKSSTSYGSTSKKRKKEHPENWAGHSVRMMLQLLYIFSMLCLLRYDEALRTTWQNVKLESPPFAKLIRMEVSVCIVHRG